MKTLCLLFTFIVVAGAQEVLTDDSIIKMVKGDLGDDLIVTMIHNQPGRFSLTPDDLVKLKQQGVSDKVLTAMVNKGPANAAPAGDVINQGRQKRGESADKTQKTFQTAAGAVSSTPGTAPARTGSANNTFFVT